MQRNEASNGLWFEAPQVQQDVSFMQKEYIDCDPPRLILVPIMELGQVLDWNGKDDYDVMAITVGGNLGMECSRRVLEAAPLTCSERDVRAGTNLLQSFVKAIACSVLNHPVQESFNSSS